MDTLHERLAELADDAPMGGASPAELWARGKRAHRLRAAAVAAVLVVGTVGSGIGVRILGGDDRGDAFDPAPAGTVDISLPIDYPVGEELPDLGDTPGRLVAIWATPRESGDAAEVVGLVAGTGTFGTLTIDTPGDGYAAADPGVMLSPDGRRIAYLTPQDEVVVHDLVTGAEESPSIEGKGLAPFAWIDADHLVGHLSSPGWRDTAGFVWEPGTEARPVDLGSYPGQPYLGYGWPYGGGELMIPTQGGTLCEPPRFLEASSTGPNYSGFDVPVLCDVVGVAGSDILLGHWNPDHLAGDATLPKYAEGTLVALDVQGADRPYLDPARRHVVVDAGAPRRVTFATDLIAQALDTVRGAS